MSVGSNTVSGEMLRGYVERLERIDAERKQLADDRKVVVAEAASAGFVAKAIGFILKKRKMKPSERQEAEALEDMYLAAMGMANDTPLFRYANMMTVDITARDQVIDAMKKFVPAGGSITIEAGGRPVRLTRDGAGNVTVTEIVEKPVAKEPPTATSANKAPVPDVTEDGAEDLGRQAARDDLPIIDNPFPYGDKRRARWDLGWRKESGNDGMGK